MSNALILGELYEKLYNEPKQEYTAEPNPLADELGKMTIDEIAALGESKKLTFQWYEGSSPFFVSLKNGITEESENWKVYANEFLRGRRYSTPPWLRKNPYV